MAVHRICSILDYRLTCTEERKNPTTPTEPVDYRNVRNVDARNKKYSHKIMGKTNEVSAYMWIQMDLVIRVAGPDANVKRKTLPLPGTRATPTPVVHLMPPLQAGSPFAGPLRCLISFPRLLRGIYLIRCFYRIFRRFHGRTFLLDNDFHASS